MTLTAGWLPFVDDHRVASVRMRSLRPVEYLRKCGVDARLVDAAAPGDVDVLVLQKAYGDAARAAAHRQHARGGAVVLDLCDNHLYNPSGDPALSARADQLRRTIEVADVVSVCTPTLGAEFEHPRIISVNDALDPPPAIAARRALARLRRAQRVLWFGTAGAHNLPFGLRDLRRIMPELAAAAAVVPFELLVVSNSREQYRDVRMSAPRLRMRYLPWRRATFSLAAAVSDVAVLPVEVNPFTRGKTSNRVATALMAGLAVVTDRLPSYLEYEGCVQFDSPAQGVVGYLRDADLRARHVSAGRERTAEIYAPAVITQQWRRVLELAIEERRSS